MEMEVFERMEVGERVNIIPGMDEPTFKSKLELPLKKKTFF